MAGSVVLVMERPGRSIAIGKALVGEPGVAGGIDGNLRHRP